MSEDLETVFKEGLDARADRRTLADNPYPMRSVAHREWAAGWAATCDLGEDDDPESTRVKAGDTDKDEKPTRGSDRPVKGALSD